MSEHADTIRERRDDGMKCSRCGEPEDRINGFCSVYCEDISELELENARLKEALAGYFLPDGSLGGRLAEDRCRAVLMSGSEGDTA